jgi:chromosome segregation ATPase
MLLVSTPAVFAQDSGQAGSQEEKKPEEKKSYLYQWTDSTGGVHITDGLDKVPQEFRAGAQRLESASGEGAAEDRSGRLHSSEPAGPSRQEKIEESQKAEWQQRVNTAKQRLADAEKRYHDLEQKRATMLGPWGVRANAPAGVRLEMEQLDKEMQRVQREINEARNEVEVVIPEAARKAGVPPGWLRE